MKILLVDDSRTVCAIYGALLQQHGYDVLVAYSMEQALQIAEEHRPPLAIVDFYMPGGNGDELTRALHQRAATANIIVAIHSQFPDVVKKALEAGAVELIGKDEPQDLFLMRVDALRTIVEGQTYQRNIEQLLNEKNLDQKPISILLVDDSATVRAVYGNRLRENGFTVYEAATLQQGEELAHSEMPDMMLVDFVLPDGRGDELVSDLLAQADTGNILMVMFSSKEDLEEAALSAGAIDIISKEDPDHIFMRRIQSMRKYVESQRKLRQLMQQSQDEVRRLLAQAEQARDEADLANKSKDDFLASMSHELRTPLTSIIGNSEILADSRLDSEQQTLLQCVEVSGRSLLALVNDILDLSKIEAGKFEIDIAPFDLTSLLVDIQHIFSTRARDSGLEFQIEQVVKPERKIWGDGKRIGQILINLLGNAVKFTEQGAVRMQVYQDDHLCFSVQDSGIGMDRSVLNRLFKPFEQADSSISRRFGGTGLGLHISGSLAELMDGRIEVSSTVGEGSEFVLKIPYRESDLPRDDDRAEREHGRHQREQFSGQVLIAEDTPELQMLERRILESFGVTVTVVENGEEALELACRNNFDLILMDMMMPVMDGLEATRLLQRSGVDAPVIALTANVMQKHREEFREAGAVGFLEKPISRNQLRQILEQYLNQVEIDFSSALESGCRGVDINEATRQNRILAVDDDHAVLDTYRAIFGGAENRVEADLLGEAPATVSNREFYLSTADQGSIAVEMVRQSVEKGLPFHTVFLDMRMPPGMNGLQTAKALRALDEHLFIVIVTAYSNVSTETISQQLEYGVLYLQKPFSAQEVKQIARLLSENWVRQRELECSLREQSKAEAADVTAQPEGVAILKSAPPPGDTLIDDELMEMFVSSMKMRWQTLSHALDQQNWTEARNVVHMVKGGAATFGYPQLGELASRAQRALDAGDLDEGQALARQLLDEIAPLLQ